MAVGGDRGSDSEDGIPRGRDKLRRPNGTPFEGFAIDVGIVLPSKRHLRDMPTLPLILQLRL